uniref:Putative ovule protein n=1 Tax=Solanum chacoense TaxID=4108 RepID=A0A0V0HZY9_SOLCH
MKMNCLVLFHFWCKQECMEDLESVNCCGRFLIFLEIEYKLFLSPENKKQKKKLFQYLCGYLISIWRSSSALTVEADKL